MEYFAGWSLEMHLRTCPLAVGDEQRLFVGVLECDHGRRTWLEVRDALNAKYESSAMNPRLSRHAVPRARALFFRPRRFRRLDPKWRRGGAGWSGGGSGGGFGGARPRGL
jgi:hypothetical protein